MDPVSTIKFLIRQANLILPGKTGAEKEAWVASRLAVLAEQGDNLLPPPFNSFADIPQFDTVQREGERRLIHWVFVQMRHFAELDDQGEPLNEKVGEVLGDLINDPEVEAALAK